MKRHLYLLLCLLSCAPSVAHLPRIVGGVEAASEKWPFVAALLSTADEMQICGGVIWNSEYIVTAAHCTCYDQTERVIRADCFQVYLANNNITQLDSDYLFDVKKIIVHRYYNSRNNMYDIALLQLSRPIDFGLRNLKARCACQPEPIEKLDTSKCVTLGWGSMTPVHDDKLNASLLLREVEVPLLPDSICAMHSSAFNAHLHVCAGPLEGGKDSCRGDSGGPLICPLQGIAPPVWSLVGLTSYGSKNCGAPFSPGYYSRVIRLLYWIEKNTGEN